MKGYHAKRYLGLVFIAVCMVTILCGFPPNSIDATSYYFGVHTISTATVTVTVTTTATATATATPTPTPTPTPSSTPTPTVIYYIDDSGSPACSDSNAGTSSSAPWCSIDKLNSAISTSGTASAGKTFKFKGGDTWTYGTAGQWTTAYPYGIHPVASGTSGNPITITAYGSGYPIINGNSVACIGVDGAAAACPSVGTSPYGVGGGTAASEISGAYVQYITINSLEIENTISYGIVFKNSSSSPQLGLVISNNYVRDTGCPAEPEATCTDNNGYWNQLSYIDYQYKADCIQITGNSTQETGGHNALMVHGDSCATALVQGNTVIGPWGHNGLDIKETNGLTVNLNVSYCPSGVACVGEAYNYEFTQLSPNSVTFTRNLSYGNISGAGLVCDFGDSFVGPTCTSGHCTGTCHIYNNTFMNTNGAGFSTDNSSAGAGTESTIIDYRNNIGNIEALYAQYANGTNTTWTHWDYNDDCVTPPSGFDCWTTWENGASYTTLSAFHSATGLGTHDFFETDPAFINPTAGNYAPNTSGPLGGSQGDPSEPAGVPYIGAIAPAP